MSAIGQLLETVETKVRELLTDFVQKNKEQDKRLDQIEGRLDALEHPAPAAVRKTTPVKPSASAPASKTTGSK